MEAAQDTVASGTGIPRHPGRRTLEDHHDGATLRRAGACAAKRGGAAEVRTDPCPHCGVTFRIAKVPAALFAFAPGYPRNSALRAWHDGRGAGITDMDARRRIRTHDQRLAPARRRGVAHRLPSACAERKHRVTRAR